MTADRINTLASNIKATSCKNASVILEACWVASDLNLRNVYDMLCLMHSLNIAERGGIVFG